MVYVTPRARIKQSRDEKDIERFISGGFYITRLLRGAD
jgi:hypothetical protein